MQTEGGMSLNRRKEKGAALSGRWKFEVPYDLFLGNFPGCSDGKVSAYNAGDLGSIPGLGRSPGEGNGNPHQYSCLENSMDRGAWWSIAYGIAKSWTQLCDFTFFFFLLFYFFFHLFLLVGG